MSGQVERSAVTVRLWVVTVAASGPTELALCTRSFVLVAGIPGAGKSCLLRRLPVNEPGASPVVLDSDPVREWMSARLPVGTPYSRYRGLVHLWHRLRIVVMTFALVGPVVVHLPATGAITRTAVLVLAMLAFRRRYLVWLDVDAKQARQGQQGRGRMLSDASFDRHVRRGGAFAASLRAGHQPVGWHGVTLLDRRQASRGLVLSTC